MKKFGKRLSPTPNNLAWERRKLVPGEILRCWCAGEVVGVHVHWNGEANKPCHHAMSDGELDCARCKAHVEVREVGYWPVIDENRNPLVIFLSQSSAKVAENIAHGTPCELSRGKGERDRVNIRTLMFDGVNQSVTRFVAKREPADITKWLFNLWKDSTLTNYWKAVTLSGQEDIDSLPVNVELMKKILAGGIDRTADAQAGHGEVSK